MSMIQSDQDESSDTSDASEVSDTLEDKVIEDEKIETRIPLSTSIVLEKLPDQRTGTIEQNN